MNVTSISWTDLSWNPVRGCSRVSEGCRNCYAERMAARFAGPDEPFTMFARRTPSGPRWTGKVELVEKHLADPLKWRKPRKIFVNSMSDLFHEALPDEAIDRVFAVMVLCRQHTFQVLTKRPERMREYCSALHTANNDERQQRIGQRYTWPLPNVWLGVSVEDQPTADERILWLLKTPAAVRFVSYEPALGPVGLANHFPHVHGMRNDKFWIIVGGESGPGARPFDIQWARNTVAQCKAAGVACFVKQLGTHPYPGSLGSGRMPEMALKDRKGGDWNEWPEDLRVREFPNNGGNK